MDLKSLENTIKKTPNLSATNLALPKEFQTFLHYTPNQKLGLSNISTKLSNQNKTLTIQADTTDQWVVNGMTGVSITLSSITITVKDGTPLAINAVAVGRIANPNSGGKASSVQFDVTISTVKSSVFNPMSRPWAIKLKDDLSSIPFTQLLFLGKSVADLPPLPTALKNAVNSTLQVVKDDFELRFYPNTENNVEYSFKVRASLDWTLLNSPNIVFTEVDLTVIAFNDFWKLNIAGDVDISGKGLQLGLQISNNPNWVAFLNPVPPNTTFPGITELFDWNGGNGQEASTGFSNLEFDHNAFDAALKGLTVGFNWKTPKLNFINISSQVTILAMPLDVTVILPKFSLKGMLSQGKKVKLVDMLKSADLPTEGVSEELAITVVNFAAAPSDKKYSAELKLDTHWQVGELDLEEVDIKVAYDGTKTKGKRVAGSLESKLRLSDLAWIDLMAAANSGKPGQEWLFEGAYSIIPNAYVPTVTDMVDHLANKLNIPSLPSELDLDIKILNLKAAASKNKVATGANSFWSVDLAGQFAIDEHKLDYFFSNNFTTNPPPKNAAGKVASVFGLSLEPLHLSDLPLVGDVPVIKNFVLDKLGFYYTNAQLKSGKTLTFVIPDPENPNLSNPGQKHSLTSSGFTLLVGFSKEANGSTEKLVDLVLPLQKPKENPTKQTGNKGQTGGTDTLPTPKFPTTPAPTFPQAPIKWIELNKKFGPFYLQKIGLHYGKKEGFLGAITLDFNGSFSIAGFEMALNRLGVEVPIPDPKKPAIPVPSFHLGGMFVDYKAPSFEIGGGFMTMPAPPGKVNFIGEFLVHFAQFGLQAYGGYTNVPASPSMFLFVHLEAPLGGPPFFFINGISGGFGINRAFKLPDYNQLTSYPLLPNSQSNSIPSGKDIENSGSAADKLEKMTGALSSLARYIPVDPGEYWVAVGLDVTSFEMIQVSAILSVAFGVDFQVGLVGSASMTIPVKEPEPIAFIQIDYEVVIAPEDGYVKALGKITPASFLYAKLVHLSGGFAFCTWFGGPHEGNFVMTIGGYSPYYKKPDYFPDVSRMQMSFGFGPLSVVGQCYFALVPHMLMAGVAIHASFNSGPINAWLDAGMDFILGWKPFHYQADAYIHIGISVSIFLIFAKVKITLHVGVDLDIWGPKFGGKAVVDLDIVSFTIHFGAKKEPRYVDWAGFQEMLPSVSADHSMPEAQEKTKTRGSSLLETPPNHNQPHINIQIPVGIRKEYAQGKEIDDLNWLIDPNHFEIVTESSAPSTDAHFNELSLKAYTSYLNPDDLKKSQEDSSAEMPYFAYQTPANETAWNDQQFGIPAMDEHNIQSTHVVNIYKLTDEGDKGGEVENLIVELQTKGFSPALWANAKADSSTLKSDKQLINNGLKGFKVMPKFHFPLRTTFIPYYYLVFDTNNLFWEQVQEPKITAADYTNAQANAIYADMKPTTAGATNLFSTTQDTREAIVTSLQNLPGLEHLQLEQDNLINTFEYQDDPILCYMSSTSEQDFSAN